MPRKEYLLVNCCLSLLQLSYLPSTVLPEEEEMCSVDIIVRAEHSKVPASRLVVDFCVKYNLCTKKLIYENKDKKSLESV